MAAFRKFKINWKLKAAAYNVFEKVPFGDEIYYSVQKHVTKTIPRFLANAGGNLDAGIRHVEMMERNGLKFPEITLLEIGAGWDLYQNIIYYMMGINSQVLVDIRRWARPECVNDAIAYLRVSPPPRVVREPERLIRPSHFEEDLSSILGIRYLAPMSTQEMPVPPESIDTIVTTSVFEHVPAEHIPSILTDFYRVLRPSGIMSHIIDFSDHYAHSDASITNFNYCKFSSENWKKFNPGIHYQNRLRHPDYITMFKNAGFAIRQDQPWRESVEVLRQVKLHPEFSAFNEETLAIIGTHTVLGKSS
jgi:hypothetical protein